ncbi:preprotein translocase subunit TatC [Candidatus Saccharibacteria bacterium]|nr:preprotein translocase subunit TatC [Candidatus Saccharibacteria bacterium]
MGKIKNIGHGAKTLHDHIKELQLRLVTISLILVSSGVLTYFFYQPILHILSAPLNAPLYYSNPAGGFNFIMRICLVGGLIVTVPVIIYNAVMFIRPIFGDKLTRRSVLKVSMYSTVLALLGALFAYSIILPGTLRFFSDFQVGGLNALISADDYLNFVTNIIATFIIVFQIPLVILFIDKIKPIKPDKLIKWDKWVIGGSLVFGLLVPFTYDLATSILISVPIIVLYNLSIVIILIQHRRLSNGHQAIIIHKSTFINILELNENLIDSFGDELLTLEKPKPMPVYSPRRVGHPIPKPSHLVAEKPAWVIEREKKRQAFNQKVIVFSDIRPRMIRPTAPSHVLTSQ